MFIPIPMLIAIIITITIFVVSIIIIIANKNRLAHTLAQESNFRSIVQNSIDGFVLANEAGIIIEWNIGQENITGIKSSEALGRTFWDVQSQLADNSKPTATISYHLRDSVLELLKLGTLSGENQPLEYFIITPQGKKRFVQELVFPIKTTKGYMMGSITRDISRKADIERVLSEIALYDELTGLFNRRGFELLADQQLKLARRKKHLLVIFFADMDNMKWINDNLGHKEGDTALVDTANVLRETFRESDVIGRLGGDEFAVVAMCADTKSLDTLKSRFKTTLQKLNTIPNRQYDLSISLGMSYAKPEASISVETLIEKADSEMYKNKRAKATAVQMNV